MTCNKINVIEKLNLINDHWNPRIVGELNSQHVKLVKFQGAFVWHKHEHEDEMFYVVKGSFDLEFRDKVIALNEQEFFIVPKGVEHRPVAEKEVCVMVFEPVGTLNTGNAESELTRPTLESI